MDKASYRLLLGMPWRTIFVGVLVEHEEKHVEKTFRPVWKFVRLPLTKKRSTKKIIC